MLTQRCVFLINQRILHRERKRTLIQFSIITVCLNAENCIRETIQSVLNQTTSNFEYIIKDGISTDETVGIAQSFSTAFAERGIPYRIISQKDAGIYDAMNQAIQEAKGEWILFMNAGDKVANGTILAQVEKNPCIREADIVYGDMIRKNKEWFLYQKARDLEYFRLGLPFSHQSVFTRRVLFAEKKYMTEYTINSDYYFYLQCYQEGKRFYYIPIAISIFDVDGISSNWKLIYLEKLHILETMPVRDEEAIQRIKETISIKKRQEFMHQYLWRFIPKPLREKRREWMNRKAGWKTEEEFFGTKKDNP